MTARTLLDKVWDHHVVVPETPGRPAVLYVDLHLIHEVTSPQAFAELAARGLPVRRPERTLATADHSTPTLPPGPDGTRPFAEAANRTQVERLAANCAAHDIPLLPLGDPRNGIVHVVGPELGATQPGRTIVCGDSHTSTHGAFGALAFGIGTTQVAQVLATQCIWQRKPRSLAVRFDGRPPAGVGPKDLILAACAALGAAGGTGHVIEYRGAAVAALGMEGRCTLSNMSIEMGARAGLIAPDDVTYEYLAGRPMAPAGAAWESALARWRSLPTDDGAVFDREVVIDAAGLAPQITYGTTPATAIPIDAPVPDPPGVGADYIGVTPGRPLLGHPVDVVFVGSCTNGRLTDIREAAAVLRGGTVRARTLVVPGSQAVKRAAEAEGLHAVIRAAGAEWREPGCSMCLAMNGDRVGPGETAVSTSNRNFEGRQGPGSRTLLASPATAAASALAGAVADPRRVGGR